jgi:hypothetical protein
VKAAAEILDFVKERFAVHTIFGPAEYLALHFPAISSLLPYLHHIYAVLIRSEVKEAGRRSNRAGNR